MGKVRQCKDCGNFEENDPCSIECSISKVSLISTDGGLIGAPGKAEGVTWAYVHVNKHGIVIKKESGYDLRLKTSPQAESLALIKALEALPEGWSGTVEGDCEYSMHVVFNLWRDKKLDPQLKERKNLLNIGDVKLRHVKGHPSKKDRARGHTKTGKPVSEYNVICDDLCNSAKLKVKK